MTALIDVVVAIAQKVEHFRALFGGKVGIFQKNGAVAKVGLENLNHKFILGG